MDCGLSFAKYSVFIFNFLFVCGGIAMIAVGGIAHYKITDFEVFTQGDLKVFPILLIIVGCVIFAIAFLGCCGAIKENTCMLFLFSIVLIGIVAAEIAIGWTAYTKKDKVMGYLDARLKDTLNKSNDPNHKAFQESWDILQTQLKCCGVDAPDDWMKAFGKYPSSCCRTKNNDSCVDPYKNGCKEAFKNFVSDNISTVALVAIGFGAFEILGIVFSCCLYSAYRRGHY